MLKDYVKNRFLKQQDQIVCYLTSGNISLNDIYYNIPQILPKNIVGNVDITIKPSDLLNILKASGIKLESHAQRNCLRQDLAKNTCFAISKFEKNLSVPQVFLHTQDYAKTCTNFSKNNSPKAC